MQCKTCLPAWCAKDQLNRRSSKASNPLNCIHYLLSSQLKRSGYLSGWWPIRVCKHFVKLNQTWIKKCWTLWTASITLPASCWQEAKWMISFLSAPAIGVNQRHRYSWIPPLSCPPAVYQRHWFHWSVCTTCLPAYISQEHPIWLPDWKILALWLRWSYLHLACSK